MSILIGTARGVAYLHSSKPTFVNQDVKSYVHFIMEVYSLVLHCMGIELL